MEKFTAIIVLLSKEMIIFASSFRIVGNVRTTHERKAADGLQNSCIPRGQVHLIVFLPPLFFKARRGCSDKHNADSMHVVHEVSSN